MLAQTPTISQFPIWATEQTASSQRYLPMITAQGLKDGALFGIPLKSSLTNQTLSDATLEKYIIEAISEVEHILDIYITPVTFSERHDYSKEMFLWSFAYLKLNHPNVISVKKLALSFNNSFEAPVAIDFPKEFIHVMPQEGVLQLVPSAGTTIGGFLLSVFAGVQFHALRATEIVNYPGAMIAVYEAGFEEGKIPALLVGLIETMAAIKVLSILGPILFPYNSVSIGIDGTSQSTGGLGPNFFKQRLDDLNKIKDEQLDAARGYYQRKFLIDFV